MLPELPATTLGLITAIPRHVRAMHAATDGYERELARHLAFLAGVVDDHSEGDEELAELFRTLRAKIGNSAERALSRYREFYP